MGKIGFLLTAFFVYCVRFFAYSFIQYVHFVHLSSDYSSKLPLSQESVVEFTF
jgi:hypothetical protein